MSESIIVQPLEPGDTINVGRQNTFLSNLLTLSADLNSDNVRRESITQAHITTSDFNLIFAGRVDKVASTTPFDITNTGDTIDIEGTEAVIAIGKTIREGDVVRVWFSCLTLEPTVTNVNDEYFFNILGFTTVPIDVFGIGPRAVYSTKAYDDIASPTVPSYLNYTRPTLYWCYIHEGADIDLTGVYVVAEAIHTNTVVPIERFHLSCVIERM